MKSILISLVIIICISCKQNNYSKVDTKKNDINAFQDTLKDLDVIKKPFCIKIDTLPKSDYYQVDLDTFLTYHHLIKINNDLMNNKFHKGTKDFISKNENYFVNYPYKDNAFAIKRMNINKNITAIFYAYLFNSEIIQPRIEIQTFNNKQENIDNLIVASTFTSECSGYREFCLDNDIIKIFDYYYCSEESQEYKNTYEFKINNEGKFIKTNIQ